MPIRTRQSCWCIIYNLSGQILLLKRSKDVNNGNSWNLPGGGVDQGETPKQAVIREVREEAGIKLPLVTFTRVILNDDRHMHFFTAKLREETKVKIDFESSTYKWVERDAIKKMNLHKPTFLFFTNK